MTDRNGTPLVDHCEGADAEDRAAVAAVFLRLWRRQPEPKPTDLHVQEFCLAVYAVDRSRRGVAWTHHEIADRLRCKPTKSRTVVARATREFGLVKIVAEPFAKGGQKANRYSIDWDAVRRINAGQAPAEPPANERQAPAH